MTIMARLARNSVQPGDKIIICGDFGFQFDTPDHRVSLLKLKKEPYEFWFVDGNHENYSALNSCEVIDWNKGKAHKVSDNIIHMMRGQCYEICGKKFFTFDGACSIDKAFRCEDFSWFPQELPSAEEYELADKTLAEHSYKVNYIITHTAPFPIIQALNRPVYDDELQLNGFLEKIRNNVSFDHWYFGHFHMDRSILGKYTVMFNDMIKLL